MSHDIIVWEYVFLCIRIIRIKCVIIQANLPRYELWSMGAFDLIFTRKLKRKTEHYICTIRILISSFYPFLSDLVISNDVAKENNLFKKIRVQTLIIR